ncbi:MAG: hypothetical protein JKY94_10010 [Rhodobacteraceae bacterium]|nr:hypothetical protein [Paracoccaceae bacterium]
MFNKSEIMTRAWELVGQWGYSKFMFRRALRMAWHDAKMAAHRAALTAADMVREQISMLENKDRWTEADYTRHSVLVTELRAV